jgi:hypothetical protein
VAAGYGGAGIVTAITAHDAGAKVPVTKMALEIKSAKFEKISNFKISNDQNENGISKFQIIS